MADWILNAARLCKKPEACAVKLGGDIWASNNFSFPIAGNIIEPGDSVAGSSSADATNLTFIHGVTVGAAVGAPRARSAGSNASAAMRACIAWRRKRDRAASCPGDPKGTCRTLTVIRQVSRPAAVRQDIYVTYGDPAMSKDARQALTGTSCPLEARRIAWLSLSRDAFVEGWKTRRHPLIEAAARAIDAGQTDLGNKPCPAAK